MVLYIGWIVMCQRDSSAGMCRFVRVHADSGASTCRRPYAYTLSLAPLPRPPPRRTLYKLARACIHNMWPGPGCNAGSDDDATV